MTHLRRTLALALLAAATTAACERKGTIVDPSLDVSLDDSLRAELGQWGAVPIGPMPEQPAPLVALGRDLFFDKILSGNRDVSCATCHDPSANLADGLALSVGTGASLQGLARVPGPGRAFTPRNAPSLLNQGTGVFYMFWDGRINEEGGRGSFKGPNGAPLPSGLTNLLAAQAMLPVLNRTEMLGVAGDVDRFGNTNEMAKFADTEPHKVWGAAMQRLLAVQEYVQKFDAAYPGVPTSALGFQHAANALAAFQMAAYTKTSSPFDRYLLRDNRALTDSEKRGGILFFGEARCSQCHGGALLGGSQFSNSGVPQLGPGVGKGAPLDRGRAEEFNPFQNNPNVTAPNPYEFAFRVPPLRNVELSAPYMHNGVYPTLDAVVRHYNNPDSALRSYDVTQVHPSLRSMHRGDAATIAKVRQTLDFRLQQPLRLTPAQQRDLVAFLKALTDPAARNLEGTRPSRVPSGLPVR